MTWLEAIVAVRRISLLTFLLIFIFSDLLTFFFIHLPRSKIYEQKFKKIFWTEFLKKLQLSGNASELIRRPFLAAVLAVHPEEDALLGPMTDIDTSAARKQSLAIRADDRNAAPSIRLST